MPKTDRLAKLLAQWEEGLARTGCTCMECKLARLGAAAIRNVEAMLCRAGRVEDGCNAEQWDAACDAIKTAHDAYLAARDELNREGEDQ